MLFLTDETFYYIFIKHLVLGSIQEVEIAGEMFGLLKNTAHYQMFAIVIKLLFSKTTFRSYKRSLRMYQEPDYTQQDF